MNGSEGAQQTVTPDLAHVLFMDIVGCSRLPTDEQKRIVGRLQEMVSESHEFRAARGKEKVISLPTGDGFALAFFEKLDAAVQCAVEVSTAVKAESLCPIRMGVHTGPVFAISDINGSPNISGAGINLAERVMSCGEDGHILLSESVTASLRHLKPWQNRIRPLGECKVKDGWIAAWNLVDPPIGNPATPKKARSAIRRKNAIRAGILLGVFVGFLSGSAWLGRLSVLTRNDSVPASIAVLPFTDTRAAATDFFATGLADDLLSELTKVTGLHVADGASSSQFQGNTADSEIAGKLNVATLLKGNVRRDANHVRITVRLVKAADGQSLWSETFDRDLNDILSVQQQIARAVAGALRVKLLPDAAPLQAPASADPAAYTAYLQGRFFVSRGDQKSLSEARQYFQDAVRLDPSLTRGWVGLASCLVSVAGGGYAPYQETIQLAREAVSRALALDNNSAEAYATLGEIQMVFEWDWSAADQSFQRALKLEPGNARVLRGAGALARFEGRLDDAIALYRRAIEIDPLTPPAYKNLGFMLHYAGRQQEARQALLRALELNPRALFVHHYLGQIHLTESRPKEALAESQKETNAAYRWLGQALAYQALGNAAESEANLSKLLTDTDLYQAAEVYAYRHQFDKAFDSLERAYQVRDAALTEIKTDPLMKGLRADPRYLAILRQMNLP